MTAQLVAESVLWGAGGGAVSALLVSLLIRRRRNRTFDHWLAANPDRPHRDDPPLGRPR